MNELNSFDVIDTLEVDNQKFHFYNLSKLHDRYPEILKLPVLAEQLDRLVLMEEIEQGLTIPQLVVAPPVLVNVMLQAILA